MTFYNGNMMPPLMKSKSPVTYQLSHTQFREEYRRLLLSKKESLYHRMDNKWNYKEVCFQHIILPMLQKYNLCPNQILSFNPSKETYSALTYGCTTTNCGKIRDEYIKKYNMRKRFCVNMRTLRIGWSSKNKNMDDLWLEIYDAERHVIKVKRSFKLMKLMAGNIKRYTQPSTQKDVVCSAAFGDTELFMVVHDSDPRVVMSVGVRKDDMDNYGVVQIPQDAEGKKQAGMPADVASLWYQCWGIQGIQEVF